MISKASKKKGRIKIPDYFIKLILLNKTKLLKEQINKKILKELFLKRHLINKNFDQPKIPNFFLANQKYKSLQKIQYLDIDFSKVHIYVYRETKDGKLANANPCPSCRAALKKFSIRNIHYTTADGYCFERLFS